MSYVAGGDPSISAFAKALKVAVGSRNQRELAAQVEEESGESVSASAVSLWLGGGGITPGRVFALERVLGKPPGSLSRFLGYLPLSAVASTTVLEALDADPRLSDEARTILRTSYLAAVENSE